MIIAKTKTSLSILSVLLLLSVRLMAQGDLLIYPKRVSFEGSARTQQISLSNTGKDTARYVISFIQIRMKEDGKFEQITQPDSGQYFSDKHVRIFPRAVTLAPNEGQVIKIQVSQSNKLLAGEYRSHLYFRAVNIEKPLGDSIKKETTGVSVKIVPVFGFSIPVIIRIGDNDTKVSLSDLKVEKEDSASSVLKLQFHRTGNMSVYGDISVQHISDGGKITQVAHVKGISVYSPNKRRDIKIDLENKPGLNYHAGKLRVIYTTSTEAKPEKLASAELTLSNSF